MIWGSAVIWGSTATFNETAWGNAVIWGSSNVTWGNAVIWGSNLVWTDSQSWGNAVIWGSDAHRLHRRQRGDLGQHRRPDSVEHCVEGRWRNVHRERRHERVAAVTTSC